MICRRVSGAVGLASFRRSGYDQQAPRQLRNAEAKADHPALAVARGDELVQHLVGPAHHHLVASILSKEGEHGTVFKNNGRTLNIWQSLKHNFKNYAALYSLSSSCIAWSISMQLSATINFVQISVHYALLVKNAFLSFVDYKLVNY